MSADHTVQLAAGVTDVLVGKGISQYDAPPMASFIGTDGKVYVHAEFQFKAKTAEEAIGLLCGALNMLPSNCKLYWRRRPEITYQDRRKAKWALYARGVTCPLTVAPEAAETTTA